MQFHPITIADREAYQSVSLAAGCRNCNFTFANLIGWQFWFGTEVCFLPSAAVLRFRLNGSRAYMLCCAQPTLELLEALRADSAPEPLCLMAADAAQTAAIAALYPAAQLTIEPRRNNADYLYLRADLAALQGGKLKNKRNHVNRFRAEHPDFEYRPLSPGLFDACRSLEALWRDDKDHDNPTYGDTVAAEQRVMETIFAHWDDLGMQGGSIFVGGTMVAFTYGAPVTADTFDVCVEKADRHVDGAFSIINQQFAAALPPHILYLNREEDMGLAGLRKAKLSYHPEILLDYNVVYIA